MKIKIWFNVGEKDPAKVWVVQEGDKALELAPAVVMYTFCSFRTGPDTPTGWCETAGRIRRGGDNRIEILPA